VRGERRGQAAGQVVARRELRTLQRGVGNLVRAAQPRGQRVQQGGLARAARAEQRGGRAGRGEAQEFVDERRAAVEVAAGAGRLPDVDAGRPRRMRRHSERRVEVALSPVVTSRAAREAAVERGSVVRST
jgi:hypothetical protein